MPAGLRKSLCVNERAEYDSHVNSSDAFDQRVVEILDSEEPRLRKLSSQILEQKRVKITRENFVT